MINLTKYEFECELSTFLISKGYCEDKTTDIIRSPSLRGILRWWFRTLANTFLKKAYWVELEKIIFGSTNERGNRGILKVLSISNSNPKIKKWKDQKINDPNDPLTYLFYTMRKRDNETIYDCETSFSIQFILNKSLFNSLMESKFASSQDSKGAAITITFENICKIVLMTFWCLIYFGGIGSRNRRGAGAINLVNPKNEYFEKHIIEYTETISLEDYLKGGLDIIWESFEDFFPHDQLELINLDSPDEYELFDFQKLYKNPFFMFIGAKGYENTLDGLEYIAKIYKTFREQYPVENRVFFGLPIITYDKISKNSDKFEHWHSGENHRRSSPIWLGIRYWHGKNFPFISFFYNQFTHPEGSIQKNGTQNPQNIEFWEIYRDFYEYFSNPENQKNWRPLF